MTELINITDNRIEIIDKGTSVYLDFYEPIDKDKVPKYIEELRRELAIKLQYIEILSKPQLISINDYRLQRLQEYPAIGDQLDALFHAGVFPPEMAAQIQAVKDKYPKPESINV